MYVLLLTMLTPNFYSCADPKLNEAAISRYNATQFTTQLSLAYTGGGSITNIIVIVSNFENGNTERFEISATRSPDSNLVWNGDFSVTDSRLVPEEKLSIELAVRNEHGFQSEGRTVIGK